MYTSIITETDEAIGLITLNRVDRQNALDEALIVELTDALLAFQRAPALRVLVLSASGNCFCAGADPGWLRRAERQTAAETLHDEHLIARLLKTLNDYPKPIIARVQGPAYGSGMGLLAACDLVVATYDAHFSLNEGRHGRIPASVLPFLLAALGERQTRRYMLTGERLSAAEAYRLGFVHELVPDLEALDAVIGELVESLLRNGPQAQAEAKALLRVVAGQPLDEVTLEEAAQRGARVCLSAEGREGLAALLDRRAPNWLSAARSELA